MPGCEVFDCFGAGQRIAQETFGGRSWREAPELAPPVRRPAVVRQLHEMLWYLTEALACPRPRRCRGGACAARPTEQLAGGTPEELSSVDVGGHRLVAGELLSG